MAPKTVTALRAVSGQMSNRVFSGCWPPQFRRQEHVSNSGEIAMPTKPVSKTAGAGFAVLDKRFPPVVSAGEADVVLAAPFERSMPLAILAPPTTRRLAPI